MNRRQKKKAYKKKYGHNPPKSEIKYYTKEWGEELNRAFSGIADTLCAAIKIVTESIANMWNIARNNIEYIQNMPEEEFNRLMESPELSKDAKTLAQKIRRVRNHAGNN